MQKELINGSGFLLECKSPQKKRLGFSDTVQSPAARSAVTARGYLLGPSASEAAPKACFWAERGSTWLAGPGFCR